MMKTKLSPLTIMTALSLWNPWPVMQPSFFNLPVTVTTRQVLQSEESSVCERFLPPPGYKRVAAHPESFGYFLRNLPLKPSGTPVMLFDGRKKVRQSAHAAVVDIDTGERDLQQCADAIMRLRAEYLFGRRQYEKIGFHFTNGFKADYLTWRSGYRISVHGNTVNWRPTSRESTSYNSFRQYLNMVFAYASTYSLKKEMQPLSVAEMKIGDVFVQAGSPGHAVIVVDMAKNEKTGASVFMLAQSYMPAQDIHILKNPFSPEMSPWFSAGFGQLLRTPEWTFTSNDLYQFPEQ